MADANGNRVALGDFNGVAGELNILLHGIKTAMVGSPSAVEALSKAPPDMPRDFQVFAVFSLVFFTFNWGLRMFVRPLALHFVPSLSKKGIITKFLQSFMELAFYGSFAIVGACVVPSQPWSWPSSLWWKDFADGGHEIMRSDLRCYYIMYIARYFQLAVSCFMEVRRKDFVEMQIHHWVTVMVIYISYVYGWNRVGVVVMVLLDPADVPLHSAKLCKYIYDAAGHNAFKWFSERLFEIFALVFFITRLVMFSYIWWSAHFESTHYFPKTTQAWTCVAMLFALLVLQVYWFGLIIKVALAFLREGDVKDNRSDSEDEEPKPSAAQKKKQ